jgi:hypothetical protein
VLVLVAMVIIVALIIVMAVIVVIIMLIIIIIIIIVVVVEGLIKDWKWTEKELKDTLSSSSKFIWVQTAIWAGNLGKLFKKRVY